MTGVRRLGRKMALLGPLGRVNIDQKNLNRPSDIFPIYQNVPTRSVLGVLAFVVRKSDAEGFACFAGNPSTEGETDSLLQYRSEASKRDTHVMMRFSFKGCLPRSWPVWVSYSGR